MNMLLTPPWYVFGQSSIFQESNLPVLIVLGIGGIMLLFALVVLARYFSIWLQSFLAHGEIPFPRIIMMSLRKVNPRTIVSAKIMAVQAGLECKTEITTSALEAHYLAGGDVTKVVEALIAAQRSGTRLTFAEAAACDLAGKDIMTIVKSGNLIGENAYAQSAIYPVGQVSIESKTMDAISLDGVINAGDPVEIVEVRDDMVIVRGET